MPSVIEREMATTIAEFLRGLPAALAEASAAAGIGPAELAWKGSPEPPAPGAESVDIVLGDGRRRLAIRLAARGNRRLGAMRLPVTLARLELSGLAGPRSGQFFDRLEDCLRRGGG